MTRLYMFILKILSNKKTKIILTTLVFVSILLTRIFMLKNKNNEVDFIDILSQTILTIILGLFVSTVYMLYGQIIKNGLKNIDFSVAFDKDNILRIFIIYNLITIPLTLILYNNGLFLG